MPRGGAIVRVLSSCALALACGLVGARAQADDRTEFEKGRNAYLARKFSEADERFRAMFDPQKGPPHDRALAAQGLMVWGAALFSKGDKAAAEAIFERLLLSDPLFEPDPLGFPTAVINDFIDTRARIREMLKTAAEESARREEARRAQEVEDKRAEAARIATLERLASEESVVSEHSRWLALVPFGVGQFQNGQRVLGWFFLGSEVAFLGVGVGTVPFYLANLQSASHAYNLREIDRAQSYLDRANVARIVNLSAYAALAATAVAGVIHAEVTFVPRETHVRPRRTAPSGVKLAPFATPVAGGQNAAGESRGGGVIAGITGTF